MPAAYDLSGRLSILLEDADERDAAVMAKQMDPFEASDGRPPAPDVVLRAVAPAPRARFRDVQNPARDGMVTASDGERLFVLSHGRACEVPDPLRDAPVTLAFERGFPVAQMFRTLVRPTLQVALLRVDAVAVHAAAVEVAGRAVLTAGWSESGKTETALALMERGAAFLSDKWTVLGADATASGFPVNVGVRRWVLPYLPRLAGALPSAARTQLRVAGLAAGVSAPVRRGAGRAGAISTAARVAERAVAFADRAALSPNELRAAYGQADAPDRRVPLGAVVILTTVPGPEVTAELIDPTWAAARLARTAAYERRDLFALLERRGYAFPLEQGGWIDDAIARERELLEPLLAGVPVIEARAPFPTDPRPVAAAVSRWL